ncbi:sensor histidine kinase [Kineosporia succinea]|uniref:histidine kinase n=1 Tax=Kineosporia succinea TaxID=84632 RepID=A0ABT9PC28_9ACTN|nr:HAMP domain-containing sensor histidine kinase [Kineosporia succinea]MDP9830260.1 two-component system OmpR family sensor kinase [Kineosporia succinea]
MPGSGLPQGLFGRLRAQMMLSLILGLTMVDAVAYVGVWSIQNREVAMTLNEASARIEALPRNLEPVRVGLLDALSPSDLYVAYIGQEERVLTASEPMSVADGPDASVVLGGLTPGEMTTHTSRAGTDFRVLLVPVGRDIRVQVDEGEVAVPVTAVLVGYPLTAKQQALRRLALVEIIGAVIVLALFFGLSRRFVASGLRPLREIAGTAEAIAGGRTTERVRLDENDPELRQVATALNDAFEAREQSENRMRDFVADASHELRTPLTAVRGWADLYRERGIQDWDGVDEAMRHIWQEAGRMEGLVEDMLTLARYDTAPPNGSGTVDLGGLLAEVVGETARLYPKHVYDLRPPAGSVQVRADPVALRRAVTNLLVNAGRHTPAGTTVRVSVVPTGEQAGDQAGEQPGEQPGGRAELRVEDDGPGLAPPDREVAFERFWRSDRSRSRAGGTGLGLAISRSVVRAAGGDLRLERASSGGLAAVMVLPTAPAA